MSSEKSLPCIFLLYGHPSQGEFQQLKEIVTCDIIPSLTVDGRKNRCIPCIYWATAIPAFVADYSNLFLPFTFFLDRPHFTFGYELVVCPEAAGFMEIIRDPFPSV